MVVSLPDSVFSMEEQQCGLHLARAALFTLPPKLYADRVFNGTRRSDGAFAGVRGLMTCARFTATVRGAPTNLAPTSLPLRHTTEQLASSPSMPTMSSNVSGMVSE